MMASSIPSQFNLKPPYPQHRTSLNASFDVNPTVILTKPRRRRRKSPTYLHIPTHFCIHNEDVIFKLNSSSFRTVITRVSGDDSGGSATGASSRQQSTNVEETNSNSSTLGDHYVALFVRMLGLDNDPLDREQSIVALWKYSLGGKKCIDNIMQFQGSINLTVNLLKSESSSTREAAAGLLRSISSINQYRDVVAESGAVEEMISLLSHPSLPPDAKEQSLCTLWNLSVDEKLRVKIAKRDILQLLVKSLEDEDIRVKEAAGGILANLALTHSNHDAMVEAGIIPKLALDLLAQIFDPSKEMKSKLYNVPGNGSKKGLEGSHANMGLNLKANEMPMGRTNNRFGRKREPLLAQELLIEMKDQGFILNNSTLSAMMLCFADNGLLPQAQAIWVKMLNSSFAPSSEVVLQLIDAYGKIGFFDEIIKILDDASTRNFDLSPKIYSSAISWFGKCGQLDLMENALEEMVSRGFAVDAAVENSFVTYYSLHGSLSEMEAAYARLKRSRYLIEKEAIRGMSFAYIRERKFYRMGEFLRDVGLGRKNVGNLLWNLLLLSYAANFKMKTLQREFLRMLEAGFHPDVTTFNIRCLAFSKMSLLWDLHLSLEHMKDENVAPDLVTYGSFVDAYVDRRLVKNLDFALNKLNLDDVPVLLTDPFVFEVLGKGDFHLSSESFMEFKRVKKWTYRELIALYLRKNFRRNQIFWNY